MKYLLMLSLVFSLCSFTTINNSTDIKEDFRECTVRIHTKDDSGKVTEYTVTFSDLSWFTCKKLQLGAWWDRNF